MKLFKASLLSFLFSLTFFLFYASLSIEEVDPVHSLYLLLSWFILWDKRLPPTHQPSHPIQTLSLSSSIAWFTSSLDLENEEYWAPLLIVSVSVLHSLSLSLFSLSLSRRLSSTFLMLLPTLSLSETYSQRHIEQCSSTLVIFSSFSVSLSLSHAFFRSHFRSNLCLNYFHIFRSLVFLKTSLLSLSLSLSFIVITLAFYR